MRQSTWINKDGISVGFGPRDTRNIEAGSIEVKGQVRQLEQDIYWNVANTGASARKAVIPAGAIIKSATLITNEAFAGGTSLSVGTIKADGTGAAATALVTATEGAIANLTAGNVVAGAGALVGKATANPVQVTYTLTGTFSAGKATLLIEYIHPAA